jgi:hypothetical protein
MRSQWVWPPCVLFCKMSGKLYSLGWLPLCQWGFFRVNWVNFDQTPAPAGRFNANAAAPLNVADEYIPGTPVSPVPDYVAVEARAFLDLYLWPALTVLFSLPLLNKRASLCGCCPALRSP